MARLLRYIINKDVWIVGAGAYGVVPDAIITDSNNESDNYFTINCGHPEYTLCASDSKICIYTRPEFDRIKYSYIHDLAYDTDCIYFRNFTGPIMISLKDKDDNELITEETNLAEVLIDAKLRRSCKLSIILPDNVHNYRYGCTSEFI